MNWIDKLLNPVLGQEVYDADNPHEYKYPELGYIEIIAKKGRAQAAKEKNDRAYDKFQHILDNVKILVDKLG